MHWAAAHPVMTVTQSELGLLVSGSRAQLPRALNRLPESLIAMSENTVSRKRSRRIDVRKYYVQELGKEMLIKLIPCGTKEMITDAFTKSLTYPSFRTHTKNNARCNITTRDARDYIIACQCLLDMDVKEVSCDGGATGCVRRRGSLIHTCMNLNL